MGKREVIFEFEDLDALWERARDLPTRGPDRCLVAQHATDSADQVRAMIEADKEVNQRFRDFDIQPARGRGLFFGKDQRQRFRICRHPERQPRDE